MATIPLKRARLFICGDGTQRDGAFMPPPAMSPDRVNTVVAIGACGASLVLVDLEQARVMRGEYHTQG